jgi:predicted methyltransferase
MRLYQKSVVVLATLSAMGAAALAATTAAPQSAAYVAMSVDPAKRAQWDVARDADRKPADVIAFSQIKPGMVVVDLVPGDAYYTMILSKLVGAKGHVYAVVPRGGGAGARGSRTNQRDGKYPSAVPADDAQGCVLGCYPDSRPPYMLPVDNVLALENTQAFSNVTVLWEDLSSYGGDLAIPEQADAVFTADGYHELHYKNLPPLVEGVKGRANTMKSLDGAAFTKSVFEDLKPGGLYIVADYAAAKGAGFDAADSLHRTDADATKAEITAAGFTLDGESKALALSSDDHTKAALGAYPQRDKTDQYLLRFKKPVSASNATMRPSAAREAEVMKSLYGNTYLGNYTVNGISSKGERLRIAFYNPDHTYQEMGKVGDGPGPMQLGTWWWDAKGHNCELHQYPIDERSNVVCHLAKVPEPVNVEWKGENGGYATNKIIPGHIVKGWVVPE